MEEARYQNVASIGILVRTARKSHVNSPPLTCRARYAGTKANKVQRRTFEKLSLLAESAGRGAFLMAGY